MILQKRQEGDWIVVALGIGIFYMSCVGVRDKPNEKGDEGYDQGKVHRKCARHEGRAYPFQKDEEYPGPKKAHRRGFEK